MPGRQGPNYKLFRHEIIQAVTIEENRFGFEPEIVTKVADQRCRVYKLPISCKGRTCAEGKKINWKDGLRDMYCILHYGAHRSPLPMQFLVCLVIGSVADVLTTKALFLLNLTLVFAKLFASALCLIHNFLARRFLVFPEPPPEEWR